MSADTDLTPQQDAAVPESADDETAVPDPAPVSRPGWVRRQWRALLVVAALIVSIVTSAALYFGQYRSETELTIADRSVVAAAASEAGAALLSYAPDTIDADLARAKSMLTGEFLTYYSKFADDIVAPAARDKGIMTTASVAAAAVSELSSDHATVLVFINQTTVSRENPDPAQAASSVLVSMTKDQDRWLISAFDPV